METDDDDDTDTQGVGLTSRRQARFVSDSLQFTGTDLGDRSGNVRRRYRYEDSEEDEDETSVSGSEDDEDEDEDEDDEAYRRANQLAIRDREEALIQSALKRISRAQAKGRVDVKLNKEELAALERQRRRMQEEEERRRNSAGSSSDRKKKQKEQRVAIPLSQLEPVSRKKRSAHPPRQDSLPSHLAAAAGPRSNSPAQVYPPMGYFPPPSTAHSRGTRSRAGTRGAHEDYSPPVSFDYAARPSSGHRHASESSARPHSRGLPHEENWVPHGNAVDPFQYQTAGPRVQYPGAPSALSKRHSGGSDIVYAMHRQQQPGSSSRSRHGSRRQSRSRLDDSETSEEQTSSDELGNGAQIREPPTTRGRGRGIVVEVSPEPEPAPSKKKSSSPTKRKSTSGRKKKK